MIMNFLMYETKDRNTMRIPECRVQKNIRILKYILLMAVNFTLIVHFVYEILGIRTNRLFEGNK